MNHKTTHQTDGDPLDKFVDSIRCHPDLNMNKDLGPVSLSLTTIPPRFQYLKDLNYLNGVANDMNIIVNIPKHYRHYEYQGKPRFSGIINIVENDYGPGTKLIGLCNILDQVKDTIIYMDDDIIYNVDQLRKLQMTSREGFILGGHGGYYTKNGDPNTSFLGYSYIIDRFKIEPCFVNSVVLMGFSGVTIKKRDLIRVCNSPQTWIFAKNPSCYYVDDDWLSYLYTNLGLKKISHLHYIASHNADKSETDGWSNRHSYEHYRSECLSLGTFSSQKVKIRTSLIMIESLHSLDEYTDIKKLVRQNHYEFANKHDLDYKIITETSLPKSHWSKIEISMDFLKNCKDEDVLFYTDFDFLFFSNNFPVFHPQTSIIMNRGCSYDNSDIMVGNYMLRCDTTLMGFFEEWLKVTKLSSELGVFNDDQIAFNLVKEKLAWKLQLEDFYRYDKCTFKTGLVGVHFPGGDKLSRMSRVVERMKRIKDPRESIEDFSIYESVLIDSDAKRETTTDVDENKTADRELKILNQLP